MSEEEITGTLRMMNQKLDQIISLLTSLYPNWVWETDRYGRLTQNTVMGQVEGGGQK